MIDFIESDNTSLLAALLFDFQRCASLRLLLQNEIPSTLEEIHGGIVSPVYKILNEESKCLGVIKAPMKFRKISNSKLPVPIPPHAAKRAYNTLNLLEKLSGSDTWLPRWRHVTEDIGQGILYMEYVAGEELQSKHLCSKDGNAILAQCATLFSTLYKNSSNKSLCVLDKQSDQELEKSEIEMKSYSNFKAHHLPQIFFDTLDRLVKSDCTESLLIPNPFFKNWIVKENNSLIAIDFDQGMPSRSPGYSIGQFLGDILLMPHRDPQITLQQTEACYQFFLNKLIENLEEIKDRLNIKSFKKNCEQWAAIFLFYRSANSVAPDSKIKDQEKLRVDFENRFLAFS